MNEQLMAAFTQHLMPQQQQPQTVVHVGGPQQPAQGDYASEMAEEYEQALMKLAEGDTIDLWDSAKEWRDSDYALGDVRIPSRVHTANPALGGLLDDVTSLITGTTGRVIGNLGGATKTALEKISKSVDSLAKSHNTTRAMAARNARQVTGINKTLNAHFGAGGRMQRVILNTLVSLPGVRSIKTLSSAANVSIVKAITRLGELAATKYDADVEDVSLEVVPPVPASDTYDTAEMDAVIDTLVDNDEAIVARIAAIEANIQAIFYALKEEGVKEAGAKMQGYITEDIFVQLGSLAPSQLVDRNEALYEAGAKYIFGAPRAPGAGLLSGL